MSNKVYYILAGIGGLMVTTGIGIKIADKVRECDDEDRKICNFKCPDHIRKNPIATVESIEKKNDGLDVKVKVEDHVIGEPLKIDNAKPKDRPDIEIIDVFDYDTGEYEKGTLVYFTEDGVVCDEGDNIIHEWQELVGEDAINHFGDKSAHEDIVYIRNNKVQTDYEFIREYLSYNETVLNYSKKVEETVDEYTKAKEFFGIDDVKEE